jgi:lactoylglutathione lyase
MLRDLDYAIIYVSDLDASTAFYRDILGIPIAHVSKGWVQFKSNGTALVLHARTNGVKSSNGNAVHLSFRVDDLDSVYKELAGKGVKFLTPPEKAQFGKLVTLCDPEDNQIDLIEWDLSSASEESPHKDLVTDRTVVNDVLQRSPESMGVLEEHGIRICGGCIVLLNSSVRETAEYSGLSTGEASRLVEELNEKVVHSISGSASQHASQ